MRLLLIVVGRVALVMLLILWVGSLLRVSVLPTMLVRGRVVLILLVLWCRVITLLMVLSTLVIIGRRLALV